MIEVKGKKGTAIVYNNDVEATAIDQIRKMMDSEVFEDEHTRIMPDVHAGKGSVIGLTARLGNKIIPNVIGVDLGCGVLGFDIGKIEIDFEKLHTFIMENIPSGFNTRSHMFDKTLMATIFVYMEEESCSIFLEALTEICHRLEQDFDRVLRSLGTLGGGNHFIEIDQDSDGNQWLLIHSGSRNFGLKVANHHQKIAKKSLEAKNKVPIKELIAQAKAEGRQKEIQKIIAEAKKKQTKSQIPNGLEYLSGEQTHSYTADMKIAQTYARLNRRIMGYLILEFMGLKQFDKVEQIESIHNYINFDDKIIRKGAISAHKGEKVLIPLNMRDGVIIGIGKGNPDWNYSAPHGAGRIMSRKKAFQNINVEDFRDTMKGIWTKCVGKSTVDESPFAYKDSEIIKEYLKETVDILVQMKPVFNFKDHDKKDENVK